MLHVSIVHDESEDKTMNISSDLHTDSVCIVKMQLFKYPSIHPFMHLYIHQLRVKQIVESIPAVSGGMQGYT